MKDGWYCSHRGECISGISKESCNVGISLCGSAHRKHPSPEQFREEYGWEYPDNGAVYYLETWKDCESDWHYAEDVTTYHHIKYLIAHSTSHGVTHNFVIICACAPCGSPPEEFHGHI